MSHKYVYLFSEGNKDMRELLATGRWKVRSLDWDDEIPVAKLVRNKR